MLFLCYNLEQSFSYSFKSLNTALSFYSSSEISESSSSISDPSSS